MGGSAKDALNQRFHRLLVVSRAGSAGRRALWKCVCDCGEEVIARGDSLRDGSCRSCGCLQAEAASITARAFNKACGDKGGLSQEVWGYRNSAKNRGLAWLLTYNQAHEMMTRDCHYCGALPSIPTKAISLNKVSARNGIDRVDNKEGYTISNCVTCCKICNQAKHTLPLSDFLSWVSRIAQHQGFTTYNPPPIQEDQSMKWTVM